MIKKAFWDERKIIKKIVRLCRACSWAAKTPKPFFISSSLSFIFSQVLFFLHIWFFFSFFFSSSSFYSLIIVFSPFSCSFISDFPSHSRSRSLYLRVFRSLPFQLLRAILDLAHLWLLPCWILYFSKYFYIVLVSPS